MRVRIGDSISNLYRKIVDNHESFEVRDYVALDMKEREEILSETFGRRFKAFWNSCNRSTIFKKEAQEEEKEKIENNNSFLVTTKVKSGFTAMLCFYFDIYKDVFEIEISSVTADNSAQEQEYIQVLNKDLEEIKACMEDKYIEKMFVKDFFATIHAHRLSVVTGTEASLMFEIYQKAKQYYPDLRDISYLQQMMVMHKGYLRGRVKGHFAHDIYGFAKSTFEQLDEEGLISKLNNDGKIKNLVYERRIDRRDPGNPSVIWQQNYLVYATYEYTSSMTDEKLRTSYHPSDLWLYLTQL